MNQIPVPLKEVDRVEIITVIDNYVDLLLPNTEIMTRPPMAKDGSIQSDTLLAEHGLSMLVTVYQGEKTHTILFDTGYSEVGVPHNLKQLGIDTGMIEAIVMSHGHMDHTGSLYNIIDHLPNPIPLVVHPAAFAVSRYFGLEDGRKLKFPQTMKRDQLSQRNMTVLESKRPLLMADDLIMVTGEVERTTEFEKGLPNAVMERNGKMEPDPIADDQALVMNLKGKGLVVVSGCSHAGIVNTVLYAKKVTGLENLHAVMGGFHLTGPHFEPIIEETISRLKEMDPEVIVPMHCTGWKAIERFSKAFSSSFVLNSVGSKMTLF
ncbi:MAG: MBL fold metallo-hydrolase [Pseudomonadota bacterium]